MFRLSHAAGDAQSSRMGVIINQRHCACRVVDTLLICVKAAARGSCGNDAGEWMFEMQMMHMIPARKKFQCPDIGECDFHAFRLNIRRLLFQLSRPPNYAGEAMSTCSRPPSYFLGDGVVGLGAHLSDHN